MQSIKCLCAKWLGKTPRGAGSWAAIQNCPHRRRVDEKCPAPTAGLSDTLPEIPALNPLVPLTRRCHKSRKIRTFSLFAFFQELERVLRIEEYEIWYVTGTDIRFAPPDSPRVLVEGGPPTLPGRPVSEQQEGSHSHRGVRLLRGAQSSHEPSAWIRLPGWRSTRPCPKAAAAGPQTRPAAAFLLFSITQNRTI